MNQFDYSKTRYPLKVSTGTSHCVRPVRQLRWWHSQRTATGNLDFLSFTACVLTCKHLLWNLEEKYPHTSVLEEMVSSCSCGGVFVNWMCPTRLKIALTRPFKTDQDDKRRIIKFLLFSALLLRISFFFLELKALLEFSFLGVFAVFLPQKLCGNISVFSNHPPLPSNSIWSHPTEVFEIANDPYDPFPH